jgi:pimeloyl-ACP methyl ester carboxylesterase
MAIVGHSMGGIIGLMYAGAYPDRVSHLAVLDGVTVLPGLPRTPIHERVTKWVLQLDKIAERKKRYFDSVAEAAERISAHNKRLTPEQRSPELHRRPEPESANNSVGQVMRDQSAMWSSGDRRYGALAL